jgi:hypothetical protein
MSQLVFEPASSVYKYRVFTLHQPAQWDCSSTEFISLKTQVNYTQKFSSNLTDNTACVYEDQPGTAI